MTICVKCRHHWNDVWGYYSYLHLCRARPLPKKIDPVTGTNKARLPFMECDKINDGMCPYYEEKPVPSAILSDEPPKLRWWEKLLGVGR